MVPRFRPLMGLLDREALPTLGRMIIEAHPTGFATEETDARIAADSRTICSRGYGSGRHAADR